MGAAKALDSLYSCAGLSQPLMLDNGISTKISHAGSYIYQNNTGLVYFFSFLITVKPVINGHSQKE